MINRLLNKIFTPFAEHPDNLNERHTSIDLIFQACLFILAFSFCLTHPWAHAYVGEAQFGDAAYWDLAGERWARGYISTRIADIRPGYSLFLGIVYSLTGVDFFHAFVAQALLLSIAVILVYQIGRLLGGRAVGLLAGLSLALNPYMAEWVALSTTEILGSVCNVSALYFLLRTIWKPHRISDAIAFGVLLGYANTVRPLTLLFILPSLLVILVFVRTSWKRRILMSAGAAVGVVLILMIGMLYQYWSGGDAGISSNAAANFYGASSPKYRTWSPDMYVEVEDGLKSRGITPTQSTMNKEFWRLTFLNYIQYPRFQLDRIAGGFGKYALFEGELERPGQYFFYRPYLAIGMLFVSIGLLILSRGRQLSHYAMIGGLLAAFVGYLPVVAFAASRGAAFLFSLRIFRRSPHPRMVAWALVVLYWVLMGLSQALVGGTEGFLLHRLYTQVEPINSLLISLGIFLPLIIVIPTNHGVFRFINLDVLVRRMAPTSIIVRRVFWVIQMLAGFIVLLGVARLIAVNLVHPQPTTFVSPTEAELETLGQKIGLPTQIIYIDKPGQFEETKELLNSPELPRQVVPYAIPGQFSRFLWYLKDHDRTEFWYFYANQVPPPSLDQNVLWVEVADGLDIKTYRDDYGLLVLVPMNAYFIGSGDWKLLNMLQARAFVPWDVARNRFVIEETIIFPISTLLVDPVRLEDAVVMGQAEAGGQVMVDPMGPTLRTLKLRPSLPIENDTKKESIITFQDLYILPGAQFKSFVTRYLEDPNLAISSPVTIELWIHVNGKDSMLASTSLDEKSTNYSPFVVDVSHYSGQKVNLSIRVIGISENPDADEVLIGEPQIFAP